VEIKNEVFVVTLDKTRWHVSYRIRNVRWAALLHTNVEQQNNYSNSYAVIQMQEQRSGFQEI
jgi:hypothetical protein